MENKRIILQQFRTNDLIQSAGKQFEFGKTWHEDYFGISKDVENITLKVIFKALSLTNKSLDNYKIDLKLSSITTRNDRKAYANGENGMSQLKDFFVNKLNLTIESNSKDYFCFYKLDETHYYLFYVPELLEKNFVKLFQNNDIESSIVRKIESRVDNEKLGVLQQIFYGAPGTGKSHTIKEFFKEKNISKDDIFRTTFHPDSDYSTFVGAYKPTMKKRYRYEANQRVKYPEKDDLAEAEKNEPIIENIIGYSFIAQTFLQAYMRAYSKTDENVYLVIEEINRGNCAQIFGDLFQLLDRNEEGYSDYTIKADADLRKYLEEELGKDSDGIKGGNLCLPPNLYIWATMNTSDQSLFPIDSAFKRRWAWKYVKIKDAKKNWTIEADDKFYDWYQFIQSINEVINNMTSSADKQLGYFFCKASKKASETDAEPTIITAETFVGKVLFYLWNDVFKEYGFDNSELFKFTKNDEGKSVQADLTFPDFYNDDNEVNVGIMSQFIDNVLGWKFNENK